MSAPSAYMCKDEQGQTVLATHVDDMQGYCKTALRVRQLEEERLKGKIANKFKFKEKSVTEGAVVLGMMIEYGEDHMKILCPIKIE